MIEIIINVKQSKKVKDSWQNIDKKVAVTFFGKDAEYLATLSPGVELFIMAEVETRYKEYNGKEYANTNITGKKYVEIGSKSEGKRIGHQSEKQIDLDNFEDSDIPF
jgi:hypothetical protein